MTRRLTRMSEHTSTISEIHHDISMSTISVIMKKKYVVVKSMSKSSVIQT